MARLNPSPDSSAVLTLADLDAWSFDGTALAVLGHPIKHSISPVMHHGALAEMAKADPRFASWRYVRFDVTPEDLPRALVDLHRKKFLGLNLTVPHKVIAVDCIHRIDAAAKPVGAVNTLRWMPDGWEGFNTDGHGLAEGVKSDLGLSLRGTPVILLGAGGAARGAAVKCLQQGCASLWIANRTRSRLDELLALLKPVAGAIPVIGFDPQHPPAGLPARALVVNATSSGLKPGDPAPVDLAAIPAPAGVYDMIYNPPETPLLAQARARGIPTANGLSMLVNQGARALEIWSGRPVPVAAMDAAARGALKR